MINKWLCLSPWLQNNRYEGIRKRYFLKTVTLSEKNACFSWKKVTFAT